MPYILYGGRSAVQRTAALYVSLIFRAMWRSFSFTFQHSLITRRAATHVCCSVPPLDTVLYFQSDVVQRKRLEEGQIFPQNHGPKV